MKSQKQLWLTMFVVVVVTAMLTWTINNFIFYGVTDETTGKFRTVASIIQREGYNQVENITLQEGSIHGMVASLNDPDSRYLSPSELQEYQNSVSSENTNIGMKTIRVISGFMVVSITPKSPAALAKLQPNDIIVAINGNNIDTVSGNIVDILAKNNPLTSITVQRNTEKIQLEIQTLNNDITSTLLKEYVIENKKIVVVDLQQFNDKTVALLEQDLKKIAEDNISGVIFDLRNNRDGSVEIAKQILERTVSNKEDYLYLQNRAQLVEGKNHKDKFRSTNATLTVKQPLVMLTNQATAAAAEMVVAGLNQIDDVPIIGSTTYGKGTVQEIIPIVSDGSAIKLTTKKWFTPKLENLTSETAIVPTETVIDSFPFTIFTVGSMKVYEKGDRDTVGSYTIASTQMVLNYFGYDVARSDGLFDDATEVQVLKFQTDHQIPQTGKIDMNTLVVINQKLIGHTSNSENDKTLQKAFTFLQEKL